MTVDGFQYPAVDLLDRVLDKGIVIDAWVRAAAAGIDLVTANLRVVVVAAADTVGAPGPRRERLREQLQRVLAQLEHRLLPCQEIRRAEDLVREERRDAHARTIVA